MKKMMMMILTAAALLGCYEKDPIPEGLTEDNFYIGTFPILLLHLPKIILRLQTATELLILTPKML